MDKYNRFPEFILVGFIFALIGALLMMVGLMRPVEFYVGGAYSIGSGVSAWFVIGVVIGAVGGVLQLVGLYHLLKSLSIFFTANVPSDAD